MIAAAESLAEPLDAVTPRDRRRAAELLACAISGDRFGVSAAVVSAQQMDRVGATVHAVAALVVDAVPELDTTALVDRLREQSVPPSSVPKLLRSSRPLPEPRPVTLPGVYLHNGIRYEVVRTRDGTNGSTSRSGTRRLASSSTTPAASRWLTCATTRRSSTVQLLDSVKPTNAATVLWHNAIRQARVLAVVTEWCHTGPMPATRIKCQALGCRRSAWAQANTKFCSQACRQAAYRARQATDTEQSNPKGDNTMNNPMTRNPGTGNVAAGLAEPQNAFPFRPGYQAPPRQDRQPAVRSTAPAHTFDGTPTDTAHAVILNADAAFRAHLGDIDAKQYSVEGLYQQVQNFKNSPAYLAVEPAVQKVLDTSDATAQAADAARASLAGDDETPDAATEARALRVWARTKGILDAAQQGGPLHDAAVKAITNAAPAERGVLAAEMDPYLKARGQASTSWLNAALKQSDPTYAAAVDDSTKAVNVARIVVGNAKKLTRAIETTAAPTGYRSPIFVDPSAATLGKTGVSHYR